MSSEIDPTNAARDSVRKKVLECLHDMTSDWDLDPSEEIGEQTMLVGDLAFESIDVVHLIVMLGEAYQEEDLGFEKLLIEDERYVTDLRTSALIDFLYETLRERGKL